MNITIFSGGSGSEQIQIGLWELFKDNVNVKIIVNGYDDGKSTGIVRKIYNDTILGPSDLRKNQLIRHRLRYGETNLYTFLNHRFSSLEPKKYVLDILSKLITNDSNDLIYNQLYDAICNYFDNKNSLIYEYNDFNIGNIIYSYYFNTYTTSVAIPLLNKLLSIPDEVFYQCNYPYRLQGITVNGKYLNTEEEIINLNTNTDTIKDIFLLDENNNKCIPVMENNVIDIINNSDIIIFSCGTLWSSLIPTYISKDFFSILKNTNAKKYLVYNIENDTDCIGWSLKDYLNIYSRYLPMDSINIVFPFPFIVDYSALDGYNYVEFIDLYIKKSSKPKHDGISLITQLFMNVFKEYMTYSHYIFDYDYTIYDKDNIPLSKLIIEEIELILKNSMNLSTNKLVSILTGNHFKNISHLPSNINGSILTNHGCYDYKKACYIDDNSMLTDEEKGTILACINEKCSLKNDNSITIEDREISICIKPCYDRDNLIKILKDNLGKNYSIIKTGRTSIEILKTNITKQIGYTYLLEKYDHKSVLYISDENDIPSVNKKIIIKNQYELYVFLKILNMSNKYANDLLIVAGGLNTRMGTNTPKALMSLTDNITVLDNIINKSKPYTRNIYLLTNDKYYHLFENYSTIKLVKCFGENSTIPNGNLETIMSGLNQIGHMCSPNVLIIWGDCVPIHDNIFLELFTNKSPFVIPCYNELNPYAYVETSNNTFIVNSIKFQKYEPINMGLHDMSIFSINIGLLQYVFNMYLNNADYKLNSVAEKQLFDLIKYFNMIKKHVTYYETLYPTKSFNTCAELNKIIECYPF